MTKLMDNLAQQHCAQVTHSYAHMLLTDGLFIYNNKF